MDNETRAWLLAYLDRLIEFVDLGAGKEAVIYELETLKDEV